MPKPIRVLIADDFQVVRKGIRSILEKTEDIRVSGEACDGVETVKLVERLMPDILLLDVEMPQMNGIQVIARLRKRGLPIKVLVISAYDDQQYILSMLNSGAAGYLVKDDVPEELVQAVRGVASGEKDWISPRLRQKLVNWRLGKSEKIYLTTRQGLIFLLLAEDRTNQEIADEVGISMKELTQEFQILMDQFCVSTKQELVKIAKH
jgi:DNA-binding NarL/FixJ family response regulator